jgi:hypothetical protein
MDSAELPLENDGSPALDNSAENSAVPHFKNLGLKLRLLGWCHKCLTYKDFS